MSQRHRKRLERSLAEFESIVASHDKFKYKTRKELDAAGAEIVNWMRGPKPTVTLRSSGVKTIRGWFDRVAQRAQAERDYASLEKQKISEFSLHKADFENYEMAIRAIPHIKRELSYLQH